MINLITFASDPTGSVLKFQLTINPDEMERIFSKFDVPLCQSKPENEGCYSTAVSFPFFSIAKT